MRQHSAGKLRFRLSVPRSRDPIIGRSPIHELWKGPIRCDNRHYENTHREIQNITSVAGIEIPSTDPLFLAVILGVHIPLGLVCVFIGAFAMLSKKRRGRHSTLGTIYFWCLLALAISATLLSAMRWSENYHLFVLGISSFVSAWLGRSALRRRWPFWARLHITGMGLSYVLMLVAFYVDNGKQLPLWKELPHFTYWLLPLLVGSALIVRALLWHALVQESAR
jgi:uncharacterized membrane protein